MLRLVWSPGFRGPGAAIFRQPLKLMSQRAQSFLAAWARLRWPLAALTLVLLFNWFFTPGFFRLEIKDGRLYGSLVDILNRGTPVALAALGMTLVIATGGVDLSVGAVMAITGSRSE